MGMDGEVLFDLSTKNRCYVGLLVWTMNLNVEGKIKLTPLFKSCQSTYGERGSRFR